MELPKVFIDIIYNKSCLLCYSTSPNMMNIAESLEIREPNTVKVLKLSDIVKYLFPTYDITCSQACQTCLDLLIKMYIAIFKNKYIQKLLNNIVCHFNRNIEKSGSENLSTYNLIIPSKCERKNQNVTLELDVTTENVLENGSFQDPVLKTTTTESSSLNKNNKNRQKKKSYNCNDCEYRSLCKQTLEGHINKHHLKVRPFVCHICYKNFYSKSNLMEHVQIHNKVGEICEFCGEKFARRQTLVDHLRLHTNDRQYECHVCGKSFVNSGRRSDHMKRNHLEKNECCIFCNKKFGLKKELIRHVKAVHA